jgi:hypothetical protein
VKPHGRVTGVFGNEVRAQLASLPAEAAFARAYWSDTIPLRVLHVEVRGTKGDGDGHPSLR